MPSFWGCRCCGRDCEGFVDTYHDSLIANGYCAPVGVRGSGLYEGLENPQTTSSECVWPKRWIDSGDSVTCRTHLVLHNDRTEDDYRYYVRECVTFTGATVYFWTKQHRCGGYWCYWITTDIASNVPPEDPLTQPDATYLMCWRDPGDGTAYYFVAPEPPPAVQNWILPDFDPYGQEHGLTKYTDNYPKELAGHPKGLEYEFNGFASGTIDYRPVCNASGLPPSYPPCAQWDLVDDIEVVDCGAVPGWPIFRRCEILAPCDNETDIFTHYEPVATLPEVTDTSGCAEESGSDCVQASGYLWLAAYFDSAWKLTRVLGGAELIAMHISALFPTVANWFPADGVEFDDHDWNTLHSAPVSATISRSWATVSIDSVPNDLSVKVLWDRLL